MNTNTTIPPVSETNHNTTLLEWQTLEFIPMYRTKTWYLVAGLITMGIIGYALYSDSITMAIVFVLLAGMFLMTHKQSPRIINVKISHLGVEIDKNFYPYNTISGFWLVYHPPVVQTLYLKLAGKRIQYLKIELNQQNPVEVRNLLREELTEIEGMSERPFDTFTRMLKLQ